MTVILGISAFYHDSAAALIVDGEVKAACQEERFSRRKHDARFPVQAIDSCLQQSNVRPDEIDYVAFYEKPLFKFERLLETYVRFAPRGFVPFARAMPSWFRDKLRVRKHLHRALQGQFARRVIFCEHHESHAASAFFPSPFEESAILTLDGVGEWATGCIGRGTDNRCELLEEMRFPHSLGLLYSAFTTYCGFRVNDGEYKLMGLAPYGQPVYADAILNRMLELRDDGSFQLDMKFFRFGHSLTMTSQAFHRLLGGPPRREGEPLTERFCDAAASIQRVTEEIVLRCARHAREVTGSRRLCLAGGVALNCVANGRLLKEKIFDEVWIQPAAGDAGAALGAAWLTWFQLLDNPRSGISRDRQAGSQLGPAFRCEQIEALLQDRGLRYEKFASEDELVMAVCHALQGGRVVGWFQGRMEFGPRALGGRSILADPRDPLMQGRLNRSIKGRESFRPFAPMVLQERVHELFDWPAGQTSPYMLLTGEVRPAHRRAEGATEKSQELPALAEWLAVPRSSFPAVTHVDYSARIQTVGPDTNHRLYKLLRCFEQQTGCPLLINTSFNVKDEPIVCRPEEALACFESTALDVLVLEDLLVQKTPGGGAAR